MALVERLALRMTRLAKAGEGSRLTEAAWLAAYRKELAYEGECFSYEEDCLKGEYEATLGESSVHREARVVPIVPPTESVRTVRFGDFDSDGTEIAYLAQISSDCKHTGMGFWECPEPFQRERLLENLADSVRPLFAELPIEELAKLHDTGKLFALPTAEMRSRDFAENRPHGGLVAFPAVVSGPLPDGSRHAFPQSHDEVRAMLAYIDGESEDIYSDSYCVIMP